MTAAILRKPAVVPTPAPPPAPSPVPAPPAIALSATMDRWGTVRLAWQNALGSTVEIYRNGARIVSIPNSGAYAEHVRPKGGPYSYVVCEPAKSRCSAAVTVSSGQRTLAAERPQSHRAVRAWQRWLLLSHS